MYNWIYSLGLTKKPSTSGYGGGGYKIHNPYDYWQVGPMDLEYYYDTIHNTGKFLDYYDESSDGFANYERIDNAVIYRID